MTKDEVQLAAKEAFIANNEWGLIAAATGIGKSKIGVDIAAMQAENSKIVIVVPTSKLRDVGWKDEFDTWGQSSLYSKITMMCYQSINTLKNMVIDLVILDEAHNLTPNNSLVFSNNQIKKCLALSATPPNELGNNTDVLKSRLFDYLKLNTIFNFDVYEAVTNGLVTPYEIRVISKKLDNVTKYIKAGNKFKPFYQTEFKAYKYLSDSINHLKLTNGSLDISSKLGERMRLIYNLKSKATIAKLIIKTLIGSKRYLIFCGSIEQAISICGSDKVYHSKTDDKALFAFNSGENNLLGAVESLNEGHNLVNVDGEVIVQLNSNERDLVQRIGRAIRFRKGHIAIIYILMAEDTVDEEWVKKALKAFDPKRIQYVQFSEIFKT